MNKQFAREQIFSAFINSANFCKSDTGKKWGDCQKLKDALNKDLGKGCSSCKKAGIYSKYRQIIFARLIQAEENND